MSKQIIADVEYDQIRVGVMEEGKLVEFYVEKSISDRVVGNIYKAKVCNVLPGMQAAFVNIGLDKNAFLYVADLNINKICPEVKETVKNIKDVPIDDVLKVGQDVLVQVTKEPVGTKGARVSTNITLPGKYIVLMPTVDYIGISRKIKNEDERKRLKNLVNEIRPDNMGVIIRTAAEGEGIKELATDMGYLVKLWKNIVEKQKEIKAPEVIYKDMNLLGRIVRDVFSPDVDKFYVNCRQIYDKLSELISIISPSLQRRLIYYNNKKNLFEYFEIEDEVKKALSRKVWLKSGGYLVIDYTEALTVVDVNTGKFVGSIDLEDTVLKTNIEAAKEIARQLRLRDIGGIIIIDFIDMETKEDEEKVMTTLKNELKKDRTKTSILGITELGLVEMTRKKMRQSLSETLEKDCPYCSGKGKILSEETMAKKVERELERLFKTKKGEAVLIELNPSVAGVVIGVGGSRLNQLEKLYNKYLFIKGRDELHPEQIRIKAIGSKQNLARLAMPVEVGQIVEVVIDEVHVKNPKDGIARIDGYVIDVNDGAKFVGHKVKVQICETFRTYAKGILV